MFRSTQMATTALVLGGLLAVAPGFAATPATTSNANQNQSSSAQQLVSDAVQTVHQIKNDPEFADKLQQAKGIFIMPDLVKAAFLVGGQGAEGVLLKHNSDGTWSNPAFLNIGSVSIGAQAGGKAGPAAMILMTDKALNDFTQANNFSLNGNAGLTVVNYSAQGQAPVGKGDIVLWSNQGGLFAGADLSGADVNQNQDLNHSYYGKQATAHQIFDGDVTTTHASDLKTALSS